MREDTKITKVYRFEELSEKARQKVMEKLADINVDYEWWDCTYDDAKTIGVEIREFDIGRGAYCKGKFTQDELDVAENILKEHGKDCETYKDAYDFVWTIARMENEFHDKRSLDDFDIDYECFDLLVDFRLMIFEDYRLLLQEEYDYLTSEEAIRETVDANEYEFTEDGEIY